MTNQEIKTVGQTIAQETQIGGNTAARVGGVVEGIGVALDNKDAANGYYQATINGGTITVNAPNYLLGSGGNLRIKMPSAGTTASTLTIGNASNVQLWYNGAAVSSDNKWGADEIISVFYDGTRFMASNSQGGGVDFEKVNDVTTIIDSANKIKLKDKDGSDAFPVSNSDAIKMVGEDKTLSEKMIGVPEVVNGEDKTVLDIADDEGNVVARFSEGHIKTQKFDSRKSKEGALYIYNAIDSGFDGFTGNGWVLSNNQYYNNSYGINNQLVLNKEYSITGRSFIYDFVIGSNGIAYFGAKAIIRNNGNPRGLVSVNTRNKTVNIHKGGNTDVITDVLKFSSFLENIENIKLRIVITYSYWHLTVKLINLQTYDTISTVESDMTQNTANSCYFADRPFLFSEYSSLRIYNFMLSVPTTNDKCWLWIAGDSITQGVGTLDENLSYAGRIKNRLQEDGRFCLISGRSSCTIDNVLQRINSELSVIKAKYALVLIGTNGGNTIQNVKDMIELIISNGSIPIICHIPSPQSTRTSVNNIIDSAISQINEKVITCYMDVATSINYDLSSGIDSTLFIDSAHPNEKGAERLFLRTLIDCAELYKL